MAYFPLFIDLTNKKCLIVGGGSVAYRKATLLLDFCANVSVVAKEVCPEVEQLQKENKVTIFLRGFEETDLDDKTLVIVATGDRELNHSVSLLCKEKNIPVNVVDEIEECSFILPSVVREKDVVAAFSSGGKSPSLTQYLKEQEKEILTPFIGEINECLGGLRQEVKQKFSDEKQRKIAYNTVLEYALENGEIPNRKKIEELLYGI